MKGKEKKLENFEKKYQKSGPFQEPENLQKKLRKKLKVKKKFEKLNLIRAIAKYASIIQIFTGNFRFCFRLVSCQ